jgi:hypothetical protein
MEKMELNWRSGSRNYLMVIELVDRYGGFESFKIYPREHPSQFVKIRGNRPLLRFKLGLKNKSIHWELVEGMVRHQATFQAICDALSGYLDAPPQKKETRPATAPALAEKKFNRGPGKYRNK